MLKIGYGPLVAVSLATLTGAVAWAQSAAKESVAAVVGGETITTQELDTKILKTNMKLAQSMYDARKTMLDQIIMEKLLGPDAAAKGIKVDELMKQKVAEVAKPVTDADIQAYFNANASRMGGKTLEQVSGQIKSQLMNQRDKEARDTVLTQLKEKAGVKVTLDPPRAEVPVAANDPIKGNPNAKVTIVEFSEFQCPFCSKVGPTLKQITDTYGDKVRIVFRDFPLAMHNRAIPAAEAAQCANEQGKFWEYHDKLFENMKALTDEDFKKYATELSLDVEKFSACYTSGKYKADVQKDAADGQAAGVTGTPAFFVNGRFLSGAQPFDAFKAIIDEELKR